MRTNRIEEVAVVAYHQDSMFKVGKVVFQPGNGFHIQVIGGLIQQEVIGIAIQGLRQHHTYFFLIVQLAHQHVMLVLPDAQPAQQGGCIAFGIPAVEFGEFLFQFGNLQAVLIGKVLFGIELFALLHDVPQHCVSHHHSIHHRISIPLEVVLTQNGKTLARPQHDRSRCRIQVS